MIETVRLKNGLRMVFEELSHVKSASVGIWVRAGSINEIKKNSGISHFIEHMMFKGTDRYSAKDIAVNVDRIGAQINAFTGKEATCYYIKTISEKLDDACDILADMFLNSKFDKELMEREKQVIYEEMKMSADDPDDLAHDMLCEMIFKEHPLGKAILGTKTSLKGITRNMVMNYIRDEYTLDSIVVSVSGSFDKERLIEFFNEKFSVLGSSKSEFKPNVYEYKRSCKAKHKDVEQAHVFMGIPTIAISDERYYSFSVMNTLMGGSMGSRLFQNVREEKGLAYSVYSMHASYQDTGYFMVYVGVGNDKIKPALNAVREELELLKKSGLSEEEMDTAKQQIKSSFVFAQENTNSRMIANGKNLLLMNRVFEPDEVIKELNNVRRDDMMEVAEFIGNINDYSVSLVAGNKISLPGLMKGVLND